MCEHNCLVRTPQAAKTETTKQKQQDTTQNHSIYSSVAISVHCCLHWCSHRHLASVFAPCSLQLMFAHSFFSCSHLCSHLCCHGEHKYQKSDWKVYHYRRRDREKSAIRGWLDWHRGADRCGCTCQGTRRRIDAQTFLEKRMRRQDSGSRSNKGS